MKSRTHRRRLPWTLQGLLLLALPATLAASGEDVLRLFLDGPSRTGANEFAGSAPTRCVTTRAPAKVCTWDIPTSAEAHATLRRQLDSTDALRLVCDLGVRRGGRCTVHTRSWARPPRTKASDAAGYRDAAEAIRALDAASDMGTLVHVLGDAPDDCLQRNDKEWVCVWRVAPGDPAHRLVAEAAATTTLAHLVCLLPLDGGARPADSCRAIAQE